MRRFPGIEVLTALALDVRWSWNHAADDLWIQLDPELWHATHSPWVVLQSISHERARQLLKADSFREQVEELLEQRRAAIARPAWFQERFPHAPFQLAAYFSMEFMLTEALPIYSGGLGNIAGDLLKTAGDLGVPLVGVGLLFAQGYFRQVIDAEGRQQTFRPFNDPGQLPITAVRRKDGERLRLKIRLPGHDVWIRVWQVQVGRVVLYLLDTNDPANHASCRGITGELYGGGPETRLQQELILGIGGWRLLDALGLSVEVCHLNEGHAAFAVLERARCFMREHAVSFDVALAATRAGNVFTTHTAVASGFDRFEPALVRRYLLDYVQSELSADFEQLFALGSNPDGADFSMANLAMRASGSVNGVSRLHAAVSRRLFAPLFPRWPLDEVPIEHVTNGVHMPSWDSAEADALWTHACGKTRWSNGPDDPALANIARATDEAIWRMRNRSRHALIVDARERLAEQLAAAGAELQEVDGARRILNPDALTVGFARRFTAYKRPNLLLRDPGRLLALLTHPRRPVQLIIAGKAHPADLEGQDLIAQWTNFIRRSGARGHAVFLADYDMLLTERLVQGVDLWINTPRRPWEACGTSGMKVLVNGGLNLSELDGWWAEAFAPEVGWAIGDGEVHPNQAAWDAAEADLLYQVLESQVVPEFYTRSASGLPSAWLARVRASMATLTPRFSSSQSLRGYVENHYAPAAKRYRERCANGAKSASCLVEQQAALARSWPKVEFGRCDAEKHGEDYRFTIRLLLNDLRAESVHVEIYADPRNVAAAPERHVAKLCGQSSVDGSAVFEAAVAAIRPVEDYTARAFPLLRGISSRLENSWILWQR